MLDYVKQVLYVKSLSELISINFASYLFTFLIKVKFGNLEWFYTDSTIKSVRRLAAQCIYVSTPCDKSEPKMLAVLWNTLP